MHVRFSTCRGMPVLDEGGEPLGIIDAPVLHPDTGRVEGFFVRLPGFFHGPDPFLSSQDILHWGTYVRIGDADALGPLEDRLRLAAIAESGRTIYGQRILTETGGVLGRCADVQFDTKMFQAEWLFPRKWGQWGIALPISEIIEVRTEAVIVRDPTITAPEPKNTILETIDEFAEAAVPTPKPGTPQGA